MVDYNFRPRQNRAKDAGKGNNPSDDLGSGSPDFGCSVDQTDLALNLVTLWRISAVVERRPTFAIYIPPTAYRVFLFPG